MKTIQVMLSAEQISRRGRGVGTTEMSLIDRRATVVPGQAGHYPLLTQKMFTEHPLGSKHCAGHWGGGSEQILC